MEWWLLLLIIFGGALLLLAKGMPVAFAFVLINILGVLFLQGGGSAFNSLARNMFQSVHSFTLLPIPLFVLMGEILWHSRVALNAIDALDKLLGRLPGRLSILTVISGTVFSSLSGSTVANTAVLGTILLPDMEQRGYQRPMSIGPILASGGLAMIVPPSGLAVILAAIGQLSIGRILIGALLPGLIMAGLYLAYILIRCSMNPALTPAYEIVPVPMRERLWGLLTHLLPLSIIVFMVTGVIVVGIATPTEAAALGCFGSFLVAALYRSLSWDVIKKSMMGTVHVSVITLAILVGAVGFSQILAFSGATHGLLQMVTELPVHPLILIICMQIIVLILGMFMEQVSIMMITLPLFIPIIKLLGFDPIWFGVLMLINLQMALTTPPFGLLLFVMKGVAPAGTRMSEIYMAGIPFLICDFLVLMLVLFVPETVSLLQDWAYGK